MRLVDNIFNSMLGKSESSPYTYYDYLESDSRGQYIDTGVLVSSSLRVVCKCLGRSGYTNIVAFGGRDAPNKEFSCRLCSPSTGYIGKTTASYRGSQQYSLGTFVANEIYTIDANMNVWTRTDSGGVTTTATLPTATFASTYRTLNLFGFNGTSTPSTPGAVICECQIYDNGILVRDFRPAVRNDDGVAGKHDVVNDVFYTNANPSGDNFLYGNLT